MSIAFTTERGTAPAELAGSTATNLPVLPPTDGYVHTGWVDYIGDHVVEGQKFKYYPTLTAVWEEPSPEEPDEPSEPTETISIGKKYLLHRMFPLYIARALSK